MALIKSAFSRFRTGLGRTRKGFVFGLRSLLPGRAINDELIRDIERLLIQGDVGVGTTARLIDGIKADHRDGKLSRGEDVLEYLKRELKALWPNDDRELRLAAEGPTVILVTGVNGAGKTTSIAKLCAVLQGQGRSVMLGACDTFRAGAVRQLEVWADRLGVEIVKGRRMREDLFEFQPTHKLWLSANYKPTIKGTDHDIWRRIMLIPFSVTIAARVSRFDPDPLAIAPRLVLEQGTTTMPSCGKLPDAMTAPTSLLGWITSVPASTPGISVSRLIRLIDASSLSSRLP
ncbi:MAG: signal recognition particle receptor subunit alpha [Planctomycetes bacterium]|nr:signal recognition particle receptor subunit alpha [Planctomycetota bacterium]